MNRQLSGTTHGMSNTLTYKVWRGMQDRCGNPKNPNYHRYGERGIRVCERWTQSFAAFFEDMGEKPEGMSLDRIDNDGNYEPSNCRWATRAEQQRNRSTCHNITIGGETKSLTEWCEIYGKKSSTVIFRLRRGVSPVEALTAPLSPGKRTGKGVSSRPATTEIVGFKYFLLAIGISLFLSGPATAGSSRQPLRRLRRETRITVLRPVRITARSAAGFPLRQAIKHGAATLDHVSAPLGWLSPAGIIRGVLFR